MTFADLLKFAFANLRRAQLRTLLTTLGVAIGTAALMAMVSYGSGLQKTFADEFSDLELFNTIRLTPSKVDLSTILSFSKKTVKTVGSNDPKKEVVLTDSLLDQVRRVARAVSPNAIVYPEVIFPCKVVFDTLETVVMTEALPADLKTIAGYRDIRYGSFFNSDSSNDVVVSEILLNRLGFKSPEEAVGKTIKLVTISLDAERLMTPTFLPTQFGSGLPIAETAYDFRIGGVLSQDIQKLSSGFRLIMPINTSANVRRLNFLSTIELLRQNEQKNGYQAIIVRATNQKETEALKSAIEAIGLNPTSFTDQFEEFKKLFLIFDLALAVIGTIALVVATLGITNTMIMSIMERYREIGIMKAVGAADGDVRKIFFIESATIGLMGGAGGVVIGRIAAEVVSALANIYVSNQAGVKLNFFHFPFWLILSAILFSIAVSLIAGYYPANRAAKIEPVEALRYQ